MPSFLTGDDRRGAFGFSFWKLVRDDATGTYAAMPYITLYPGFLEIHLSPCQLRDEAAAKAA